MERKLLKLWGALRLAVLDPYEASDQIEDHASGLYSLKVVAPISVSIVSAFGGLDVVSDHIKTAYQGSAYVALLDRIPAAYGLLDFAAGFLVTAMYCITFAAMGLIPGYGVLVLMHDAKPALGLRRSFNYVTYNCFAWMAVIGFLFWGVDFVATGLNLFGVAPQISAVLATITGITTGLVGGVQFLDPAWVVGIYIASICFSSILFCRISGRVVYSIGLAVAGILELYLIAAGYILLLYKYTRFPVLLCSGFFAYILGLSFVVLLPLTAWTRWRWRHDIPDGWMIKLVRWLSANYRKTAASSSG